MKGWEIFVHSVRLVFSNIEAAFKLSLLPYAISGLAFVFLGAKATAIMREQSPEAIMAAPSGLWVGYVFYILVSVIAALWIAVSWHRYVLLEEYPSGWFPTFHGGAIMSYFGRGFLVGLLIVGVVLVVMLLLGLVMVWAGAAGAMLVAVLAFATASYLFYRLCPVLPSAAINQHMSFGDAWRATSGNDSTIAVLVILLILSSIVVQLPNQIGGPDSAIGIVYSLVVGWFMMLIGVSVLTTFYGHFVEGRTID
jgi:hypothetical protein